MNKQPVLDGDKWIILNVIPHCFRVARRVLILSCWLGYSIPILYDEIISSSYIQKCQSCLFLQSPIAMSPLQDMQRRLYNNVKLFIETLPRNLLSPQVVYLMLEVCFYVCVCFSIPKLTSAEASYFSFSIEHI